MHLSRTDFMSKTLHPYYLQQMGIETWSLRKPIIQSIKLMIIGEALEAGGLLSKMINSIGLTAEDISIKSTLTNKLVQDIAKNPPQLVLALGNVATQFLLNDSKSINTLRGKTHTIHNTPIVVSYHPTDLLQNPADKRHAWQDLLCVQQILAQPTVFPAKAGIHL